MRSYYFLASWLDSQSKPSYRPSPEVAHVAWMYQFRCVHHQAEHKHARQRRHNGLHRTRNRVYTNFSHKVEANGRRGGESDLAQRVQPKLVCNVRCVHCVREILLVCKDKENSVPELILVQHSMKLVASLSRTVPVVGIDNKDEPLRVLEVVPPEGSDLVLATDVPHLCTRNSPLWRSAFETTREQAIP